MNLIGREVGPLILPHPYSAPCNTQQNVTWSRVVSRTLPALSLSCRLWSHRSSRLTRFLLFSGGEPEKVLPLTGLCQPKYKHNQHYSRSRFVNFCPLMPHQIPQHLANQHYKIFSQLNSNFTYREIIPTFALHHVVF